MIILIMLINVLNFSYPHACHARLKLCHVQNYNQFEFDFLGFPLQHSSWNKFSKRQPVSLQINRFISAMIIVFIYFFMCVCVCAGGGGGGPQILWSYATAAAHNCISISPIIVIAFHTVFTISQAYEIVYTFMYALVNLSLIMYLFEEFRRKTGNILFG